MHRGLWVKDAEQAREFRGKTLCLIGYGKIASQESVLAESWGMQVVFYDITEVLALGDARRMDSMEDALKVADVVSIHVDGRDENRNLIGADQFEMMKDGVVYIDSSRGFVTDTQALAQYKKNGKLKGAAIDVHDNEPEGNNVSFESPLQGLDNVILTPHIGGGTHEAQKDIAQFVSDKLLSFINVGDTTLSVNFPNIQLPDQTDAHRFLHLHRNVPGVLAAINEALAGSGLNVLGQYLQTTDDSGYVITDVNREYNKEVLRQLRQIPETLRFRVLY